MKALGGSSIERNGYKNVKNIKAIEYERVRQK
jgi:hypothetical protein